MGDFWTELEQGSFRKALASLDLVAGRLGAMHSHVIARYKGGAVAKKEQILPIKAYAAFISESTEKSAFTHLRAGNGDATGMQSFAKSMVGFLGEYAAALSDQTVAPATIFSDMVRERAKALLNVARAVAQNDGGDSVWLSWVCLFVCRGGGGVLKVTRVFVFVWAMKSRGEHKRRAECLSPSPPCCLILGPWCA